jgi:hypothetical protein
VAGEAANKKKLRQALKTVKQEYLPGKQRYEQAKRICGKRNSYAKTDPDATFMKMKEDHMGNGQWYERLRKQRPVAVETVFGQVKGNQ